MAITIRKLSVKAENKLSEIIENNRFISTKTKAIEYALEQHEFYKSYKDELEQKNDENYALKCELENIKEAINLLKNV
ncbi:hypothetical protein [Changchengzhania lutea]|uniref:hypothetical protein n=1 Tax=Changchengzhania lutea TaxID=2049305 RepID=UPI00115D27F8|nr:hypothetical protein [Changchengzhania lutea]